MNGTIMLETDIDDAATAAVAALRPQIDHDWSVQADDLAWSCRRTLDHLVDTMLLYGSYVATEATARRHPVRNGDPHATIAGLLDGLLATARMLSLICAASPPSARAFHPAGRSDADGFRAMACSEILTHTDDIMRGFGDAGTWAPDPALCERVIRRVFPWAPGPEVTPDRWLVVRWACGRTAMPGFTRLDERWWWHAAPIDEWDGNRLQRTTPPAWI